MKYGTSETSGSIPSAPTLVLPDCVDVAVVQALEQALGGREHVAWMVDNSRRPVAEVMQYLSDTRAAGFMTDLQRSGAAAVVEQVRQFLLNGRHVVFLSSGGSGIPGRLLNFADDSTLSALPVCVSMFNDTLADGMGKNGKYSHLRLRFMPVQAAGAALGARVRGAWSEGSADALAEHPLLHDVSLPHALLESLLQHPNAVIIDGVNDSQLSYKRLLAFSIMFCRYLRKHVSGKRIGIILPPGKLSIIANLSCIFAGISPVNINYTATPEEFRHHVAHAGLERFITEDRFIHKQQQFSWPSQRDLIYIERVLTELSNNRQRLWDLVVRWAGKKFIAARLGLEQKSPDSELMLYFTEASGTASKGVPFSQRMLMSAALQLCGSVQPERGQRVLSASPLYRAENMLAGVILPILLGRDIITYPTPGAGKRISELIHNYGVALAVTSPSCARAWVRNGTPEQYAGMRHLLITGERMPDDLVQLARETVQLHLCECYSLPESAAPITMAATGAVTHIGTALPEDIAGATNLGTPMPGVAVRIMDLEQKDRVLPPSKPGVVWLRGPAMVQHYLHETPEDSTTARSGRWFCTGNVGSLDDEGMLNIYGSMHRFSKIDGELVPHERAEELLCRLLGVDPADELRRLALVGVPSPKGKGEILVLLSTVHKVVRPHDVITLRYGMLNARYPAAWAPDRILAVPSIPVLSNGKLDYEYCRRGACRMLGIKC